MTNDKQIQKAARSYRARMAPRADLIDVIEAFKAGAQWQSQQAQGADTLTAICDLIGIGVKARSHETIMSSVENIYRFSEMLHAVEHTFFMVPGEPDDEFPDEAPDAECLLNSWGSTKEQYLDQFEKALSIIRPPAPVAAVPTRLMERAEEQIELLKLAADQYEDEEDFELSIEQVRLISLIRDLMNQCKIFSLAADPAEPDKPGFPELDKDHLVKIGIEQNNDIARLIEFVAIQGISLRDGRADVDECTEAWRTLPDHLQERINKVSEYIDGQGDNQQ